MEQYAASATPDHIELEFELAGPGARGGAVIVDTILMILGFIGFVLALGLTGTLFDSLDDRSAIWLISLVSIVFFLVQWSYFILFEFWLNGQTPGKKLFGLRVVRDNGLPAGPREIVVRNLLRAADFMPSGYMIGGLAAFYSKRGKRLGDMAAGTMVVRESRSLSDGSHDDWSAQWVAKLERGDSRHALTLSTGQIDMQTLAVMDQFRGRAFLLPDEKRAELAWKLVSQHLSHFDLDPDVVYDAHDMGRQCERVMGRILEMASFDQTKDKQAQERKQKAGKQKSEQWSAFGQEMLTLLRGGRRKLRASSKQLGQMISDYRRITSDLARARSMGADHGTLKRLNALACAGHNVLYGQYRGKLVPTDGPKWPGFARSLRAQIWSFWLASALLFGPALISFLAVIFFPETSYDLIDPAWMAFDPASEENMHDIPSAMRPLTASGVMTNNINIALTAFALGLTFGIGTSIILIFNGVYLGSIAAWFHLEGNSRAFWGWVMPHGGTELLAIVCAGAAGLVIGRALVAPGRRRRIDALQEVISGALAICLGSVVMLVIAGIIEGFVSPSDISYPSRIFIFTGSIVFWAAWWISIGRGRSRSGSSP